METVIINGEKYYSQKELEQYGEKVWKDALHSYIIQFPSGYIYDKVISFKYPTYKDYLLSLTPSTISDKREEDPKPKFLSNIDAYNEGFAHGVRFCERYGIPLKLNL